MGNTIMDKALSFFCAKRVVLTGHTGFKGTWLSKILVDAGAKVLGYSRCSAKYPDFFALSGVGALPGLRSVKGDVRDLALLEQAFTEFQPELVFHLAAQPIVRESYVNPVETYGTNVMGTVNVLECIRKTPSVKSAVIVTTDKVYRNDETARGFREDDRLDGFEPYSNSKSCAELVTACYRRSYPALPPISTARAGNVLGGGDFAKDRIIPDCVRAVAAGEPIIVRNPHAVRPFQHVLEALSAYLLISEKQYENPALAGCYNVGPEDADSVTVGELVALVCEKMGGGATWQDKSDPNAPHEASYLKLDHSLITNTLGWRPKWQIAKCLEQCCRWYRNWLNGGHIPAEMEKEIGLYLED